MPDAEEHRHRQVEYAESVGLPDAQMNAEGRRGHHPAAEAWTGNRAIAMKYRHGTRHRSPFDPSTCRAPRVDHTTTATARGCCRLVIPPRPRHSAGRDQFSNGCATNAAVPPTALQSPRVLGPLPDRDVGAVRLLRNASAARRLHDRLPRV